MNENIVLIGAGGLGKEVVFLLERLNCYHIVGFLDDGLEKNSIVSGYPVLGDLSFAINLPQNTNIAICIANPRIKKMCYEKLKNLNFNFPNIIDKTVLLGKTVELGKGNILFPYTTYTADITLGDFNIVDIHSTIGHDAQIENYNTIYPNANISGRVRIGNEVEIGVGSQILQGLKINSNSTVGAGAVVIADVRSNCIVAGIPAKIIKKEGKSDE
ncbi:acetyltransferase [Enterococcus nangangensis]